MSNIDLPNILNIVETACREFANPATHAQADRTLQEFRSLHRPYEACQYILERSTDPSPKFHAVLALREAALREWATLDPRLRHGLLRFLLQVAIVTESSDQQPLVRRQAAAASATLLKRAWGEASQADRHALMQEIDALAAQAGTAEARRSSMDVLQAITVEFNPLTSSPMGLPWSYHEECRVDLQEGYLIGFLQHALDTARQSAGAAVGGADAGVCEASISLLSSLLNWDHAAAAPGTSNRGATAALPLSEGQRPGNADLHVRPPVSWRELLLADSAFNWLAELDSAIRVAVTHGGISGSSSLAQGIRQLIVQLASMTGDVFVKEGDRQGLGLGGAPGPYTRAVHLHRILAIILPGVTPPHVAAASAAAGEDDAILDYCRALLAAATAHRMSGLLEASSSYEAGGIGMQNGNGSGQGSVQGGGSAVLITLSQLTAAMLATGDAGTAPEVADVLLEMWAELVIDPCRGAVAGSEQAAAAAATVFNSAMQRELATAAAQALEDEEEYAGGEEAHSEAWLAGLAAIGRAACAHVLPALGRQLHLCQSDLQACIQSGADPSAALEKLCWVVRMSGHVLADCGDGEMPLIPVAVADACIAAGHAGVEDPAVGLARCLVALGAVCYEHAGQPIISPRLLEDVCATLGRWADSYLLLDPGVAASPALDHAFGSAGEGPGVADALVRLATAALTRYPGEKVLHRTICVHLLGPMVRREGACAVLVRCPAWLELCGACASGAEAIRALEAGVHRRLLQCLCLAAGGLSDIGAAADYINSLVGPLSAGVQALAAEPPEILQRPDRAAYTLVLVQSLRGAARGSRHITAATLYSHLDAAQPSLLCLLRAYQLQPAVHAAILKLAADVVEYYSSSLDAPRALALFQSAVLVVDEYYAQRSGATKPAVVGTAEVEEEYRATVALLRLLTQLTNAEAPDEAVVAGAVLNGLSKVLPLISEDHLKFPKLRHACFSLLAHVVEAHAPRVAELPASTFNAMLTALCFGITFKRDLETDAAVFEAVAALARYHVLACKNGEQGLGALNAPNAQGKTPLAALLDAILRRVLIEDPGFGAVDFASEAVLPLLLVDTLATQAAAESMVEAAGEDYEARMCTTTAFVELIKASLGAVALDRQSRRAFAVSFRRFALETRGVLQRK